jgi:hypothetical protein
VKRLGESQLREALNELDLPVIVYKPPDDARNWKPSDFLVWIGHDGGFPASHWIEVKDTDQHNVWPASDLRPSQRRGILEARRFGIPYWLAIYWRNAKRWTISDAARVLAWFDEQEPRATSIKRELLMTRFGVECPPRLLASTLKQVFLGEVP